MDELSLIEELKKTKVSKSVRLGIGDDAAVLESPKKLLVFCGDMIIEGVHFLPGRCTYEAIGHKAAARTLSDIAAMAAIPRYLGVSLALPAKKVRASKAILKGIKRLIGRFSCDLVGGDLSSAPLIFVDTWCVGEVEKNRYLTRAGAKSGDGIFVSGRLGGSLKGHHLRFLPKIEQSRTLRRRIPIHAMIDISDGLVVDLWRVLSASGKGALLFAEKIPLTREAQNLDDALFSGEDYELLFTAPLRHASQIIRMGCFQIGVITERKFGFFLVDKQNHYRPLDYRKGFQHFS